MKSIITCKKHAIMLTDKISCTGDFHMDLCKVGGNKDVGAQALEVKAPSILPPGLQGQPQVYPEVEPSLTPITALSQELSGEVGPGNLLGHEAA